MELTKASQLSEYSDKELIKEWDIATQPGTAGRHLSYAQDFYTSSAWLDVRDEIKRRGLDKETRVKEIDKRLLLNTLKYGAYGSMEENNHPMEDWWWHLHQIAKREYPADLLPEHLREIYERYA